MVRKFQVRNFALWQRASICVSAALVSMPLVAGNGAADELTSQQQLAHDIYRELVEIDTTTATGDDSADLDFARRKP